jgi:hypothetical protein
MSLNQFHHDESSGVAVAQVIHRDDVGMIERRSGFRFLHETGLCLISHELLRAGFAPGCEAVALPRPRRTGLFWARPLAWACPLLLQTKGRTKGIAQLGENSPTAGQSHHHTSDGEAELPEPTTFEAKP